MKTSNQIQREFGNRVRELRRGKGLSQEQFSFECELDRTYVSQVELGRRNISLQNIKAMADALDVHIGELFTAGVPSTGVPSGAGVAYRERQGLSINCGFTVSSQHILESANATAIQLQALPFSLYQSIDLKTLSSIVGAVFVGLLADQVGAMVNPIEKGHPDIIPTEGRNATEAQLRNYPNGLEVKSTVGNVEKGSNLQPGTPRIGCLTGLTWQAHHREVRRLLGLAVDFAGRTKGAKRYPVITGCFYTDALDVEDWGEISGTTGRNTKVTGMRSSGKSKMGAGWVLVLNQDEYVTKYQNLLDFDLG
ncbi:MAG: helix-turn-helix transcriptional regulator [Planctomycetota bacterium]